MDRGSGGAHQQPVAQSSLFLGLPKVEEFVPVDDFFDSYVSELNSQGHAQTRTGNWNGSKQTLDLGNQQNLGNSRLSSVNVQQLAYLLKSRSQANSAALAASAAAQQSTGDFAIQGGVADSSAFNRGGNTQAFAEYPAAGKLSHNTVEQHLPRPNLEALRQDRALQQNVSAVPFAQAPHGNEASRSLLDTLQASNSTSQQDRQGTAALQHTLLEKLRFASQRFNPGGGSGPLPSLDVPPGFGPSGNSQTFPTVLSMDASKDELSGNSGKSLSLADGIKSRRNPKQQMQNKQAQARYRERQKHKLTEMEQTISDLQGKVQLMESLEKSYGQLQARTARLEEQLQAKEQEMSKLKEAIQVCPTCSVSAAALLQFVSSPQNKAECFEEVAEAVQQLREFLDSHQLRAGSVQGDVLAPADNKQLVRLVDEAVTKRIRALRAEGVKVSDLMSVDVRQLSRLECMKERGKWQQIINVLEMIPWQQQNIVALRTAYLTRLQQIYGERQSLNMKAMSYMMPRASEEEDHSSPTEEVESQLQCLSINGYLYASSRPGSLPQVLAEIRENLRSEQKLIAEANYVMLNRVLSAVQAARFIVEAYPHFLDCLALANALAINLSEGPSLETDACEDMQSGDTPRHKNIDTFDLNDPEEGTSQMSRANSGSCGSELPGVKRQATGCISPQDISYGLPVSVAFELCNEREEHCPEK